MHPNRYCLNTVQEKLRFPFKSFSFPIWVSQHNVLHILSTTHKCFLLPQIMSPLFSPSILHYIENSILRLTDSHDFHSGLVTQQWTTLLPRSICLKKKRTKKAKKTPLISVTNEALLPFFLFCFIVECVISFITWEY